MRIILASIHPQWLSGQITAVRGLATLLQEMGQRVDIITAVPPDPVPILEAQPTPQRRRFIVSRALMMARALLRTVRNADGADLVHLHLPTPAFTLVGDVLQAVLPIPVVVSFEARMADCAWILRHGLWEDTRFYAPRLVVNNPLPACLSLKRAARYVVSSDAGKEELRRLGFPSQAVHVLPNAVVVGADSPMTRSAARQSLGLPEAPLVAYLGHFHHVKGVHMLVQAFARLRAIHPNCRLILAWSGLGDPRPIRRQIHRLGVSEQIIWLGRIPATSLFSAADVVALPYLSAMGQCMFPAVLLEALQAGVPLVTSDLEDFRCLFGNERGASLVPPGDVEALTAAISRLLEDEKAREETLEFQRRVLARRLNPRRLAEGYLSIYREAIESHRTIPQHNPSANRDALRGQRRLASTLQGSGCPESAASAGQDQCPLP